MQHMRDETPDEGNSHVLDVLQDDEHQGAARSSIELEAIFHAMADGLIEVDRAGRIVRMNPAARGLIGLDAERDYVSHPLAQRLALLHLCDSQEHPVGLLEGWSFDLSAEDDELLSEERVFCHECGLASGKVCQHPQQERSGERIRPVSKALLKQLKTDSHQSHHRVENMIHRISFPFIKMSR